MWACVNLVHLLLRRLSFHLFCDHKNLIYISIRLLTLGTHARGSAQVTEHVDGEKNDWSDLISRWGGPSDAGRPVTRCKAISRSCTHAGYAPPDSAACVRVSTGSFSRRSTISSARRRRTDVSDPAKLLPRQTIFWRWRGRHGSQKEQLVQRVMIVAHCGNQGHRG
ncbi:Hypothetical protein PHPALM_17951 [Phytophthora palmivora]|uniref:Secreted protein n=1 Tax=Phytophthora palmivora TaxID=4796 RepID=A0A2P4XL09_9STRA|nr:Hypothetical protein PHPALM_17951 [Phytophthora palmivora]